MDCQKIGELIETGKVAQWRGARHAGGCYVMISTFELSLLGSVTKVLGWFLNLSATDGLIAMFK